MFSFYNEDCYEFMKTLPDRSVDLILTDPPYEVSGTTGGGSINKVKKLDKSLQDLVTADIADGKCYPQSYEDAKTFFVAPLNQKDKKLYGHPTPKPVDMLEKLVRNSTREGQVVFDSFSGSESTGEACLRNNRNFIGTELNPTFYATALERLQRVQKELTENA